VAVVMVFLSGNRGGLILTKSLGIVK
jgi:hypothetical protein